MADNTVIRVNVHELMKDHCRLHNLSLRLEAENTKVKEELNCRLISENKLLERVQFLEAVLHQANVRETALQQQAQQHRDQINGLQQENGMLKSRLNVLEEAEVKLDKAVKYMAFRGVADGFQRTLSDYCYIPQAQQVVVPQQHVPPMQFVPHQHGPPKLIHHVDSGFGSGVYQPPPQQHNNGFPAYNPWTWTCMMPPQMNMQQPPPMVMSQPPPMVMQQPPVPMSFHNLPPIQEATQYEPHHEIEEHEQLSNPGESSDRLELSQAESLLPPALMESPKRPKYIFDTANPSENNENLFDFGADTPASFEADLSIEKASQCDSELKELSNPGKSSDGVELSKAETKQPRPPLNRSKRPKYILDTRFPSENNGPPLFDFGADTPAPFELTTPSTDAVSLH